MSQTRSSRGNFVDFELLAIKAQLASVPVPKQVEARKVAIEEREGGKPAAQPAVNELLKIAQASANISKSASPKQK